MVTRNAYELPMTKYQDMRARRASPCNQSGYLEGGRGLGKKEKNNQKEQLQKVLKDRMFGDCLGRFSAHKREKKQDRKRG